MAKKIVFLLVVCAGLGVSSCATYSTVNGVATPLGALSSAKINAASPVVAEYSIILGLITAGYEDFLEKVKGQDVDIIDSNFLNLFRKVQAVKKR